MPRLFWTAVDDIFLNPFVPRSPKNGWFYDDKILLIELPKNRQFYGLLWKPVNVGTQTVMDGQAHFHRFTQKWVILWKMLPITHNPFKEFWFS
jgi:hypothetical protein